MSSNIKLSTQQLLRKLGAYLFIVTLLSALSSTPSQARALLAEEVAQTIAEYVEPTPTSIQRLLTQLGAEDSVIPSGFNSLSALQQIQWAYGSVESAQRGSGKDFIRSFIALVARKTPSIMSEPEVSAFSSNEKIRSFTFSQREARAPSIAMEPEVARVIAIISDTIASRGSGITAMRIMERKLGLSKTSVVSALLKFSSGKDALADKLARLPNPPQKKILAEIALDVMTKIPAARDEQILGETVFRWLGLGDKTYGEWFEIRETMISKIDSGEINLPDQKKLSAQSATNTITRDYATMIKSFLSDGSSVTPKDIERMHYEYIARSPDAAALWGFAVIALKKNLDTDSYIQERAERLKKKYLSLYEEELINSLEQEKNRKLTFNERLDVRRAVAQQHGNDLNWEEEAKSAGAKPYMGYLEYVKLTGFGDVTAAARYFDSTSVSNSVREMCPVD